MSNKLDPLFMNLWLWRTMRVIHLNAASTKDQKNSQKIWKKGCSGEIDRYYLHFPFPFSYLSLWFLLSLSSLLNLERGDEEGVRNIKDILCTQQEGNQFRSTLHWATRHKWWGYRVHHSFLQKPFAIFIYKTKKN